MDRKCKSIFTAIEDTLGRYDGTIMDIVKGYRTEKEAARAAASVFKNENEEFERRLTGLKAKARAEIKKADEALVEAVKGKSIPILREALGLYTAQIPNDNFIKRLRVYEEFGLTMTLAEARQLADLAADNNLSLHALASVAARSGLDVRFPQVEDYEHDLQQIEALMNTPICYAPTEYLHEALELFEKQPVFSANGGIAYWTQSNSVSLLTIGANFRTVFKGLDATGERWAASVIANVLPAAESEKDDARQTAAEAVNVEDTTAIEHARRLGEEYADAMHRSEEIMKRFTSK